LWLELEHRPAALVDCAGQTITLDRLRGQKVAAFCGIGNPAGFQHTLAELGCQVVGWREYSDHFAYPPDEIQAIERWAQTLPGATAVGCTHKDLVKIPRQSIASLPLWGVRIELAICTGQAQLEDQLRTLAARIGPDARPDRAM
jgi:tetraacyldisaccharide 4'-kinase